MSSQDRLASRAIAVDRPNYGIRDEISDDRFVDSSTTDLPIMKYRDHFLYLLENFPVVVVVGETGCGKSTQLPQFLLDAEFDSVCVAVPRRMAAVTLASFVACQRNESVGFGSIGYSIRNERCSCPETKVTYMTTGMLLRTFLQDPLLEQFQVVMIDELHERSCDIDLCVGLMKKVLEARKGGKFRLVLTSATMNSREILEFFNRSQTVAVRLKVDGRHFPIRVLYAQKPVPDYVKASFLTILRIHEENPEDPGGILCFLPGQAEIRQVYEMLNDHHHHRSSNSTGVQKLKALMLYACLSRQRKSAVFERWRSSRVRKVVLATSIAETSLTVPDIVFVVDCGFTRQRFVDKFGFETVLTVPVSRDVADQRAGRAGRIRSGVCYRLYQKSALDRNFSAPELCRLDLSRFLLQMLSLGVSNVCQFDLPTQLPSQSVLSALDNLLALEFIDPKTGELAEPHGRVAAELPVDVECAALLLRADQFGCVKEALDIVAMLQVKSVFSNQAKKVQNFGAGEGDLLSLLNAMQMFARNPNRQFCQNNGLNHESCSRALQIRHQLKSQLDRLGIDSESSSSSTDTILRCIVCGLFRHCVRLKRTGDLSENRLHSYESVLSGRELVLHRDSVLYKLDANLNPPNYLVFYSLSENDTMFDVSVVKDPKWLSELVPHFFQFGTQRQIQQPTPTKLLHYSAF